MAGAGRRHPCPFLADNTPTRPNTKAEPAGTPTPVAVYADPVNTMPVQTMVKHVLIEGACFHPAFDLRHGRYRSFRRRLADRSNLAPALSGGINEIGRIVRGASIPLRELHAVPRRKPLLEG
jgi:hypothetical protein